MLILLALRPGTSKLGLHCLQNTPKGVGETGASWSENCIFLHAEAIIHLLVLISHCIPSIVIFLTYSLVFHSENDRF